MPTATQDPTKLPQQTPGMPAPLMDESVTKAVTGLMNTDSPLMTQAKTSGLQQANRRGLLNSSMAVGAAQDAAYRAALPIAAQEASQNAATNMQARDITATQQNLATDIQSRTDIQNREIQYQTGERALDRGLQEQLASWNLASSDRNAAAQFLTNMETMFQSQYQSIMNNTNLDTSQRAQQITSAQNLRNTQIDFVQQMYDIQLSWPR